MGFVVAQMFDGAGLTRAARKGALFAPVDNRDDLLACLLDMQIEMCACACMCVCVKGEYKSRQT